MRHNLIYFVELAGKARRFSRIGTSRRARGFEIFAPTWINPPGKIHALPIQRLDLGKAQAGEKIIETPITLVAPLDALQECPPLSFGLFREESALSPILRCRVLIYQTQIFHYSHL